MWISLGLPQLIYDNISPGRSHRSVLVCSHGKNKATAREIGKLMKANFLSVRAAAAFGLCLLLALGNAAAAQAPRVVASILPLHSLTAAVMEGVGEPELLVPGAASPHSFSLRPSDARSLEEAALVIWIGEELELFLEQPLRNLAEEARLVTVSEIARSEQ